jgi:hypothetical protein
MKQGPHPLTTHLGRFLAESLPTAAMAHSDLADLRWDPALGGDPSLAAFSENALHELHHHVAIWGALLRLDRGDPAAWSSLGLNLARFLHRREITREMAARLGAAVRQDPRGRSLLSLIEEGNRQVQGYWPVLLQVMSAAGWSGV